MVNALFGNIYRGKKVLVTGNTGFKGCWLTMWLLDLGAEVYGLSKDVPSQPSMFEELHLEEKIRHYWADVRDLERVKAIIDEIQPDFVFHLAAQPIVSVSYADPVETLSSNVMGTAHVLEALRFAERPCTAVMITSDKCYDNVEWVWGYKETDAMGGKDIYSGSKGAAELVIKSYYHSFFRNQTKIRIGSARAGNVIGGGDWALDRIIPDCMRAWSKGEKVEIRSPKATRPWQHVLEPLSGYLQLGKELAERDELLGQSFNFGPEAKYNYTVEELLRALSKTWGYTSPEQVYDITGNIKFHEAGLLKLNCDKALFFLKWLPALDYETLIEFTGGWYYNYYKGKTGSYDFTMKQIHAYVDRACQKQIAWTL